MLARVEFYPEGTEPNNEPPSATPPNNYFEFVRFQQFLNTYCYVHDIQNALIIFDHVTSIRSIVRETICLWSIWFGAYGFGAYGFWPYGFGAYGFGPYGFGAYGFGPYGFGPYNRNIWPSAT